MVVSYIWGAALWMYATLVLFELWGSLGLLLGFVLLGFGSVPLACIAALLHGEWALLGEMVFGFVIIAATRFLGIWIASKGTSQWDQYEVAD